MKSGKTMNGIIVGVLFIIAGYVISIWMTGIETDEERADKLGTLFLLLGGIITSAFFSKWISCRT